MCPVCESESREVVAVGRVRVYYKCGVCGVEYYIPLQYLDLQVVEELLRLVDC